MVQFCCASGCNNKWTPNGKIRFHRFPIKRPDILELWLRALGLDDFAPDSNRVVCSEHFTANNYYSHKMNLLKKDAVPSKLIRLNNEGIERNTVIKSELSGERTQMESSMGEEVDPTDSFSQNQTIKIKEEIEDVDIEEDRIDPLYVKVEEQEERKEEFEFISLDTIVDTSQVREPNRIYRKYKNKSVDPFTEKFEQVTVKEEVDFSSTYCEMCNIKFDHKDQFEEHCVLHNKRSTYFCSVCLEVYKTKRTIVRHFAKHRKIQLLSKCNLCNYTFGSKEDLDMHVKTFKHIKQFSCEECGKEFFLKSNLTIHKRLHTNEIFKCNICQQKFARRLFLQNHMIKHDNKKAKKKRDYKCLRCDFTTEDQTEITEHNKNHDPMFKCRKCNFTAKTYAEVRKHRDIHLADVTYRCQLCPYETHKKYRLTEHQATHFDVKPHECYICKVRLSTRNSLTRHIKSHTEGCFECNLCKKTFNLLKYLKDHMKRHVNKDLFECEMCDFKCYKKYDLDKHQIAENHKKMHQCEICTKEFTTKHSYKLHLSVHAGTEKFECIICEDKFVLSRQLLQHMKLAHPDAEPLKCDVCEYSTFVTVTFDKHKQRHEEIKPYVCNICKVGFNYNQSLKKHMASHLGLTPYECKICDKKYSKHDTLKQHMLSHSRSSTSEKSDVK